MSASNITILALVILLMLISLFLNKKHWFITFLCSLVTAAITMFFNSKPTTTKDLTSTHLEEQITQLKETNAALSTKLSDTEKSLATLHKKFKEKTAKNTIKTIDEILQASKLVSKNPKNIELYESDQHNIRFTLDEKQFHKIHSIFVKKEAVIGWKQEKHPVFGYLVAENYIELGISKEEVDGLINSSIKNTLNNYKLHSEEQIKTNAGVFRVQHISGEKNDNHLTYCIGFLENNGYLYQIHNWAVSSKIDRDSFRDIVYQTLKGFELIDPSKKASSGSYDIANSFNAKKFGIKILKSKAWQSYNLNEDKNTSPIFGGYRLNEPFLIYSGYLPEEYSHLEILSAYLHLFAIGYDLTIEDIKTKKLNDKTIHYVVKNYTSDQGNCHSKLELHRLKDRFCLIRTWAWQHDKLLNTAPIWNQVQWSHSKKDSKDFNDYRQDIKECSAKIINHIGVRQYQQRHYLKAKNAFELAYQLDPSNPSYSGNILEAHIEMGQTHKALTLVNKILLQAKSPPEKLLEAKARILSLLGEHQEAITTYQLLFSNDYNNDQVMQDYLKILLDQKNYTNAENAASHYYKKYPSTKTLGWVGYMQLKNSNYKAAEKSFLNILKNTPNDTFTLNSIIELYIHTEQYNKAMLHAEKWIQQAPKETDAKLAKINILTAASKKAEAFDYAKKLSIDNPDNEQIKTTVAKLSSRAIGWLGTYGESFADLVESLAWVGAVVFKCHI